MIIPLWERKPVRTSSAPTYGSDGEYKVHGSSVQGVIVKVSMIRIFSSQKTMSSSKSVFSMKKGCWVGSSKRKTIPTSAAIVSIPIKPVACCLGVVAISTRIETLAPWPESMVSCPSGKPRIKGDLGLQPRISTSETASRPFKSPAPPLGLNILVR